MGSRAGIASTLSARLLYPQIAAEVVAPPKSSALCQQLSQHLHKRPQTETGPITSARSRHNAQLDREQTAIVECVAATHNAVPLVGGMLGLCQAAIASPKARAVTNDDARWFTEHVKPGTGLVVIAPMSVGDVLGSLVRLIAWRARRSLGRWRLRRHRRTPIGSTNMGSSGRASRPV